MGKRVGRGKGDGVREMGRGDGRRKKEGRGGESSSPPMFTNR